MEVYAVKYMHPDYHGVYIYEYPFYSDSMVAEGAKFALQKTHEKQGIRQPDDHYLIETIQVV